MARRVRLITALVLACGLVGTGMVVWRDAAANRPGRFGDGRVMESLGNGPMSVSPVPHLAEPMSAPQPGTVSTRPGPDADERGRGLRPGDGGNGRGARSSTATSAAPALTAAAEAPGVAVASDDQRPAPRSSSQPGLPPQAWEPQGLGALRLNARMDLGFTFDPATRDGGRLRLNNESHEVVTISFHGESLAGVRLNGQDVVAGQAYLVQGEVELTAVGPVGVHIRTPKPTAVEASPDGNG